MSYVHFHRAGGANVLPINGPQVINAVINQTPTQADFRPTEAGYPAGITDPSRFNPLLANVTYMPEDYHSSRVQSWFVSVQREVWDGALVDLAYIGNRADGLLLFANLNQAAPNNSAGTLSLQSRRPIAEFGDITYSFNGGKSRYHAFQGKFDWKMGGGFSILNSLTLSQTKDNGAGSLENASGNFPAPQNFYDLEADFALGAYHQPYNNTTSFVLDLPIGTGRRFAGNASPALDLLIGGWQIAGVNSVYAGEAVTFIYSPAAAFQVSGIQQDFRGANNYRPNIIGEVEVPKDQRTVQNWFNRRRGGGPDGPQPAVRQRPAQCLSRSARLADGPGRVEAIWRCRGEPATSSSVPSSSISSTARTSARQPAIASTGATPRSARSRRPTIRGSSSLG